MWVQRCRRGGEVNLLGQSAFGGREFTAGRSIWHDCDPGLDDSVRILDRVRFGLGVRPQDISTMEDVALSAYDTLWGRLGSWAQVRALYRKIDL